MNDVNMDEPLIKLDATGWLIELSVDSPPSVTVSMTHLVQVLAALPGEQLGAVIRALPDDEARIDALGELARSIVLFHCERADREKARADRAEQRVRELEGVLGITQTNRLSPTAEELRLWSEGLKIHALKSYRERNDLDLPSARRIFEECAAALVKP
jgi:hypothetical protein